MKKSVKKVKIETTTTLDGMMTFGKTDNGQHVLDFKATEYVEMPAFKALCFVQGMTDGNVYISETPAPSSGKRNPRVFEGRYITITLRNDGTLRPNFKEMTVGPSFNPYNYAIGVYSELLYSLQSLIEK